MQIKFHELSKFYETEAEPLCAVDRLSWDGESGRIYGFLGPNGSGKTSTIKMLLDLLRPDVGYIEIDGKRSANRGRKFRQSIGYLPEERGLYKKEKAIDVIVYFAQLKGLSRKEATRRARQQLEKFELEEFGDTSLSGFSKGMSQKIQLILATIHQPRLAILDEPFTGLDPVNVRMVRDVIFDLKSQGALIILSTHRMSEAELLCDDILMLRKGRIALYGPQRELREANGFEKITLRTKSDISHFPSVHSSEIVGDLQNITLRPGYRSADLLRDLSSQAIAFNELHITPISLEDLYVRATEVE